MKQLSLFDLFDEAQNQFCTEKAPLTGNQANLSSNITASEENPMMSQWVAIKKKYPDAILLFRVCDFYEAYNEDAQVCARVLNITLYQRGRGDMNCVAFPFHTLDNNLPKLVRTGHRVAICDQLNEPIKKNKQ